MSQVVTLFRLLILIVIVIIRQPTVSLWASYDGKLTAARIKEMKALASQVLGVKETEETLETQETNTNTITPVSTTDINTQTEVEGTNNTSVAT